MPLIAALRACPLVSALLLAGAPAAWAAEQRRPRPVRSDLLRPAHRADAGRPAARRSPAAAQAAGGDGPAHGRARARPLAPRLRCFPMCSTRCFPAAKEQKAMLDARLAVRRAADPADDRHGNRSQAGQGRAAAPRSPLRWSASSSRSPAASRSANSCPTACLPIRASG